LNYSNSLGSSPFPFFGGIAAAIIQMEDPTGEQKLGPAAGRFPKFEEASRVERWGFSTFGDWENKFPAILEAAAAGRGARIEGSILRCNHRAVVAVMVSSPGGGEGMGANPRSRH